MTGIFNCLCDFPLMLGASAGLPTGANFPRLVDETHQ
jgi:hypothetical protein